MAEASLPKTRVVRGHPPAIRQICKGCGKPFLAHALVQVACSVECKFTMYQNKGEADKCWEWSGPLLGGYGLLFMDTNRANGRRNSMLAHRYSFMRAYGDLPSDKPCVLHSCDNPRCTNPAHLRAGTRGENNSERSAKGRSGSRTYSPEERARYAEMNRGERNNWTKLTEAQAKAIKYQHRDLSNKEVGALYGVSDAAAYCIRTNRTWAHL